MISLFSGNPENVFIQKFVGHEQQGFPLYAILLHVRG
jgi:hypothetical protein